MGDRKVPWQLFTALMAAALIIAVTQPRSLYAQSQYSPPALEQRVHSFNIDQPTATAYSLWNSGQSDRHEVWFRILGGDAQYQQRLRVYKEQAAPRGPNMLPPESEVVYEVEGKSASQWTYLGSESSFFTYYFDGDNRPNSGFSWDNARAVRLRKTVYQNGDLYEISFEDLNTLDDYNDLEVEVVLLHD